jgi:hypothetical protein
LIGTRRGALEIIGEKTWHERPAYVVACDCGRTCLVYVSAWEEGQPTACGEKLVLPVEEMFPLESNCQCAVCQRKRAEMFRR